MRVCWLSFYHQTVQTLWYHFQNFLRLKRCCYPWTIFPFHSISSSNNLIDPFSDVVLPNIASNSALYHLPATSSSNIRHADQDDPKFSYNSSLQGSASYQSLTTNTDHSLSPIPRRTARTTKAPSYFRDYHCNLLTKTPHRNSIHAYPLCKSISYTSFSPAHKTFLLNISSNFEP